MLSTFLSFGSVVGIDGQAKIQTAGSRYHQSRLKQMKDFCGQTFTKYNSDILFQSIARINYLCYNGG